MDDERYREFERYIASGEPGVEVRARSQYENIPQRIHRTSDAKISIDSITAKTGLSRRVVDRVIAALKDKGLLIREGAKNNAMWIINPVKK